MTRTSNNDGGLRPALLAAIGIGMILLATGCGQDASGTRGTLAGTVTNGLTATGIGGLTIALNPAIEVDLVTGEDGTFSQELPVGVYTWTIEDARFESQTDIVSIVAGGTATVAAALTPVSKVVISPRIEGQAVPGGMLSATAEFEILDGSTLQGMLWTQSNSVTVEIAEAESQSTAIVLPAATAFKEELIQVLTEPPIGPDQLPENVPLPDGVFPGGLPGRYLIVGTNPFALEEAGRITVILTVTTTSGSYAAPSEIHVELPWRPGPGLHNVPVDVPVLLHARGHTDVDNNGQDDLTGATVGVYDWSLQRPSGSQAALLDATSRNPYFTPDVPGAYTVAVTDTTQDPGTETVVLELTAGTWQGAITGQDANSRPLASNCTGCHNDTIAPDIFTPWAQTGHAEIFTTNVNTNDHYGENCFACHTVGYQPGSDNNGTHLASDFDAFLASGLLTMPAAGNWTTVLADYPDTARMANVQCENCHGPQNSLAHTTGTPRMSLSADVCATCHGEPLRHARFQQWQLSAHANYELATDEGTDGSCARCHTANGFLAWLPILLDDDPTTDPLADVAVTWSADQTHPQTCVTCHDPHNIGTASGDDTNAVIRISGDTPPLIAGFSVIGAGRGAICMTCHNSRRGLHNDDNFSEIAGTAEAARAPHGSAQTDVLMGQNAYFVEVGIRGNHSLVSDTCVNCHMNQTPPPDLLSYNQGGANHTFYASADICSKCHGDAFDAAGLQSTFEASAGALQNLIERAVEDLMGTLLAAGNTLDLNGDLTLRSGGEIVELIFGESAGRQAITVVLTAGGTVGPYRLTDVDVVDGSSTVLGTLNDFADERLLKSGWNWNLVNNDGSRGVHHSAFVFGVIDQSIDQLNGLLGG